MAPEHFIHFLLTSLAAMSKHVTNLDHSIDKRDLVFREPSDPIPILPSQALPCQALDVIRISKRQGDVFHPKDLASRLQVESVRDVHWVDPDAGRVFVESFPNRKSNLFLIFFGPALSVPACYFVSSDLSNRDLQLRRVSVQASGEPIAHESLKSDCGPEEGVFRNSTRLLFFTVWRFLSSGTSGLQRPKERTPRELHLPLFVGSPPLNHGWMT